MKVFLIFLILSGQIWAESNESESSKENSEDSPGRITREEAMELRQRIQKSDNSEVTDQDRRDLMKADKVLGKEPPTPP